MEVRGTVKDRGTKETIVGAKVFLSDFYGKIKNNIGSITDIDGRFRLEIPTNEISNGYLTASFFGYTPKTLKLNNNKSIIYNFEITDKVQSYGDIEIIAESPKTKCEKQGGVYDLLNKRCDLASKPKVKVGGNLKKRLILGGVILLLATVGGLVIYKRFKK